MDIINIKDLKKAFGDLTAIDGISITVESGEIHGILGPNGAGKSTTIGCITGLLPFDSGSVTYEDGQSIGKWKKNIGYIPQDLAIYPDLTAEENVRFFCSLYGFKGSELKKKTEEALDFVGLLEVKRKKASEFSGGMKRRLNMACHPVCVIRNAAVVCRICPYGNYFGTCLCIDDQQIIKDRNTDTFLRHKGSVFCSYGAGAYSCDFPDCRLYL